MIGPPAGVFVFLTTDIVGSVQLWERDEPGMRVAVARHDRLLRDIVARHGGRVVKGSGDGIWAVFWRSTGALDAALAIQAEIGAAFTGASPELRVRVAVHAGEAEERDGDFFGRTPNLLARLVERTRGGRILVSDAAVLLAGSEVAAYDLRHLGELRLRGVREPLSAFELRDPGDAAARGDADRMGVASFVPSHPFPTPSRLVGRAAEVATLWAVLERGRESGQVIVIRAPAGTGKSTLVGELVRRAHDVGTLCLAGGAYEQTGVAPFGPLRDALADYLLSLPNQHVHDLLEDVAPDLASIVPDLVYHLRLRQDAGATPDSARRSSAVFACLARLARAQPVLLCLEDLHVADAGTLALVHDLTRRLSRLPLTLCLTYRDDEVQPGQELARLVTTLTREGAARVELTPLDRDQTGQLIASLLDGPASDLLRDSLYSATEGNPLFLEQSVLALREEGRIGRTGRVWRGLDDGPLSLSVIVRDVLERRIGRLSRRCHGTVVMGAVLGQTFEYDVLSAARNPTGAPDLAEQLIEDLEEATAARVLREVPSGYAFTHALLREELYRPLSERRRMHLHGEAGAALERVAGARTEERASELAHHFVLAADDPETRAKALDYSLLAGRRAYVMSAYREAFHHFGQACRLTQGGMTQDDRDLRLAALEGRGQAARSVGAWRDCIDTQRMLLELCDDPVRRASARDDIAHAFSAAGHTDDARRECEAGLAELDGLDGDPSIVGVRVRLQYDLALLLFLGGRYRQLVRLAEEMLGAAQRLGEPLYLGMAHMVMGWGLMGLGQVEPSLHAYGLALEAACEAGHKIDVAVGHVNLGIQHYRGARFAAARPELERAIALFREAASDLRAVNGMQTLSRVYLAEGDLERAEERAQLVQAIVLETDDRWAAECHDLFGTMHAIRAEWEDAAARFTAALHIRERVGHMAGTVESLIGLAQVYERQGDWSEARRTYERAMTVAGAMDPCPQAVAARRQLGRLLVASGAIAEGAAQLREALALADTMADSLEYAPTLIAVAQLTLCDDPEVALSLAERALAGGATIELRVEGHAVASRAALAIGRDSAAESYAERAAELARVLGAPRSLGVAQLALGRVQAARRRDEATRTLARACEYFEAARCPHEQAQALQEAAAAAERLHDDRDRAGVLRLDAERLLAACR